jgi:hypothetical protein
VTFYIFDNGDSYDGHAVYFVEVDDARYPDAKWVEEVALAYFQISSYSSVQDRYPELRAKPFLMAVVRSDAIEWRQGDKDTLASLVFPATFLDTDYDLVPEEYKGEGSSIREVWPRDIVEKYSTLAPIWATWPKVYRDRLVADWKEHYQRNPLPWIIPYLDVLGDVP